MSAPAIPAEPIPFRVLLDEAMRPTRRHFGRIYLPVAIPLALLSWDRRVRSRSRCGVSDFTSGRNPAALFTGTGCIAMMGKFFSPPLSCNSLSPTVY